MPSLGSVQSDILVDTVFSAHYRDILFIHIINIYYYLLILTLFATTRYYSVVVLQLSQKVIGGCFSSQVLSRVANIMSSLTTVHLCTQ